MVYPQGADSGFVAHDPPGKTYVNGVDVSVLNERNLYFDADGKAITVSLKDYTCKQILNRYASLDDFLQKWSSADRKEAILAELQEEGVLIDELFEAVGRECDLFDIICHVAFDRPPLTRRERANNVKKRNYFSKYGETARKVLDALLDKYADEGVEHMEDIGILRIQPFDEFGSPLQIIGEFGGKPHYLDAVRGLECELYMEAL